MTENILEKWYDAKEKISILEGKIEKYKKEVNDLLKDGVYKEGEFMLKKKKNSRKYISKEMVPKEIFEKYSKTSSFDAYYITKIKK
jgi:hypothetical protein